MTVACLPAQVSAPYAFVMQDDGELSSVGAFAEERADLGPLLERYLPQLHAWVRLRLGNAFGPREASVDVVQSICRQVLSAHSSFEFEGEERFRALLLTAALNKLREEATHKLLSRALLALSDEFEERGVDFNYRQRS